MGGYSTCLCRSYRKAVFAVVIVEKLVASLCGSVVALRGSVAIGCLSATGARNRSVMVWGDVAGIE